MSFQIIVADYNLGQAYQGLDRSGPIPARDRVPTVGQIAVRDLDINQVHSVAINSVDIVKNCLYKVLRNKYRDN